MKVSIVVPPRGAAASADEMTTADELAEALRSALAIDVPVLQTPLADLPADGYLLVFHTVPWVVDPEVARRIIAIDEGRANIMQNLENNGFAGAVESHRYFLWRTQRDNERGDGLVAKSDVAARMPVRVLSGPYSRGNYSMIASDTARDLPGLIAEYLKAYDAAP